MACSLLFCACAPQILMRRNNSLFDLLAHSNIISTFAKANAASEVSTGLGDAPSETQNTAKNKEKTFNNIID